jgi:malate dehydrogenase
MTKLNFLFASFVLYFGCSYAFVKTALRPFYARQNILYSGEQTSDKPSTGHRVTVIGASGGIGQPLSLLLKMDPRVSELKLFDIVKTPGVAADLSHINTVAKAEGFVGYDQIEEALTDSDVVLISAGIARQPGMTRDDLFQTNANIVKRLAEVCSRRCSDAMFLLITNPVNSLVPVFAEVLKSKGCYNKLKVLGITTLDATRANTFYAERKGVDVKNVRVNVIGGHAGTTILPLLSQIPNNQLSNTEVEELTHKIQFGGDEVVKAKDGAGSATLSMAYSAHYFTSRLLSAFDGEKDVIECAYCENSITDSSFFSTPVLLGKNGIEKALPFGTLSEFEQKSLDNLIPDLKSQVKKGIEFAALK